MSTALRFDPIYLSTCVCSQDLLVWLTCRSQQAKNSTLPPCRSHRVQQASTRTAWRQPIVPVSRDVSPTVWCGCHAIYFSITVSPRCEDIRHSAAPAKKPTDLSWRFLAYFPFLSQHCRHLLIALLLQSTHIHTCIGYSIRLYVSTWSWLFYPKVTTLRSVFAIADPSVVCNVRAPYSGGWNLAIFPRRFVS